MKGEGTKGWLAMNGMEKSSLGTWTIHCSVRLILHFSQNSRRLAPTCAWRTSSSFLGQGLELLLIVLVPNGTNPAAWRLLPMLEGRGPENKKEEGDGS